MMPKLVQPLKWFGGKFYLAPHIVAMMPRHRHYVEPFAGGLAVLLERDPNDERLWIDGGGVSEVVNDLNQDLVTFWRVIADQTTFAVFKRRYEATPLGRRIWEDAGELLNSEEQVSAEWVPLPDV